MEREQEGRGEIKEKKVGEGLKQEKQSLPRPLVWQRRQPLPQQVTTRPVLMEGVKRTNVVVVRELGLGVG